MRYQVILPTYNASRWFAQALESVTGHPDGEILVIDDGSREDERDAVAEICAQHKDVRFFAEPHRGITGTLNYGLSLVTAPYIARMDADDISLPGRFDKQLAFLDANADIALVGGQMTEIDSDGRPNGKSTRFPASPDAIAAYLDKGRNPFMHPSVMMRRDAVMAVGGYRPATEYAEDFDLWLRLVEKYPLANIDEPLINYRRHEAQITCKTNWPQKFAHDLATLSARRRRANEPDPIDDASAGMSRSRILHMYDPEVARLIAAYNTIEKAQDTSHVSSDEIRSILTSIDAGLMGRSSKSKAKAAARAAKCAWQESYLLLATRAIGIGLKRNPLACFSGLIS